MASPKLIVFGPQTNWPTADYLAQLRSMLLSDSRLHSFVDAIKGLPSLWKDLVANDPRLQGISGGDSLNQLVAWLVDGEFRGIITTPPNVLSMPFTVIIHMAQWFHYLDNNSSGAGFNQLLESARTGGVQGFCIGLLSAVAVATSQYEEHIGTYAGVALRLATCVGAYIDLDRLECDTTVLAVRWTSPETHNRLVAVLKEFPNAYISVIRDTADANITCPKSIVSSLSQYLMSQNISFKSAGLEGRCHSGKNSDGFQRIMALCSKRIDLNFPTADKLRVPVRSNADAQIWRSGSLTALVVRDIMLDISNWYLTMVTVASQLVTSDHPVAVSFGLRDSIPSSVVRESGMEVLKWRNATLTSGKPSLSIDGVLRSTTVTPSASTPQDRSYPDHSIAVIGMACRFPGADSVEEFWDLLVNGGSMCAEMPPERFSTKGLRRSPDGKLKFYGNFIRDADAFDHRFFKKSSREAASMDPQQRILLEVAYAAMESSGYFGTQDAARDIGVYLGACSNDYNDNVASHNPNAFSSLGTLRAFLSGRISHWFDWTGPSITYDTACSSSAVAIDAACKAIQVGDCSQAVAGGVSLYTNPNFYQNLAAASFLSPTGPTKPFDLRADGYCRGEGIGLVVLKKLSQAIADGDNVIGVIAGSAVNQNRNCTYITVPHGGSQQDLYTKVARQAEIKPKDISYVEAHGTGTPVGDPIEFESIYRVFANEARSEALRVASVKGNIGHLEGAAGIAALIKVCLMLQKQQIPVQANYITMNPKIAALGASGVEIPTSTIPWNSKFRAACVNNYGAAGSNAAMIVREGPALPSSERSGYLKAAYLPKHPIYISADSMNSLRAYAAALSAQVQKFMAGSENNLVGDFAFNLANKQNRKLPYVLSTSVSSPTQLLDLLSSVSSGNSSAVTQVDAERKKPVVLCFGGQVSDFVGLDKEVFEHSSVLRRHFDSCDAILRAAGLPSLYPGIFQTETVRDVVHLHGMLFSLQYSSAKAWLDSGLRADAVIGHSFGQLTALCVSGSLSLTDALKLVCGRASLMKTHWGSESGSMISLQADLMKVSNIITSVKSLGHDVEVACYNGPTSHVLVGTSAAIDAVQDLILSSGIKSKRLQVTHGFHSRFTEPLLPELKKIAATLDFRTPEIPLETCSEGSSWGVASPQLIADHTRTPVFFSQAVQRLSSRLGPCTWVEAGSSSSITAMVRGALDKSAGSGDLFVPVSLRPNNACELLADATVSLWKAGYPAQFWPFNRQQRAEYANINLPPYQFEKSRHWLEWKDTVVTEVVEAPPAPVVPVEPVLLTFSGITEQGKKKVAEFLIDPRSKEYVAYVKGHAVLAEPLCPAPLYVELIAKAAMMLDESAALPTLEDLEIKAPLGLAADRLVTLTLIGSDRAATPTWSFEFTSQLRDASAPQGNPLSHATGVISMAQKKKLVTEFAHYERLVSHKRFTELREDPDTEAVQGSMIYKVFEKVVTYAPYYKGVKAVFSKDRQVAGSVILPAHNNSALENTITRPLAVDNFFQVAGLHVNSLNDIGEGEVFVCTKVDSIRMSTEFTSADSKGWTVYSTFAPTGDREIVNDIFVFDTTTKKLVYLGLGAHFTRVSISSLTKVLSRANKDVVQNVSQVASPQLRLPAATSMPTLEPIVLPKKQRRSKPKSERRSRQPSPKSTSSASSVAADVRKVLAKVAEMSESDIKDDSTLNDLGIDSLMIMEVLTEVQNFFKLEIPNEDWQTLETPKLLAEYLAGRGCGGAAPVSASASRTTTDDSASDYSGAESETTVTSTSSTMSRMSELSVSKTRSAPPTLKPKPSFLRTEAVLGNAQQAFEDYRYSYDTYASQTGFAGFWKNVYPTQAKLVLAYTVEAFRKLGSDLTLVDAGEPVPPFKHLEKHNLLVKQLYNILEDAGLVASNGATMVRTEKLVDMTPSGAILEDILRKFPQHSDEHRLLHITGSKLAECLAGTDDAINLLFRNRANKELLERVYQLGPMYEAITQQLGDFLAAAFQNPKQDGVFHILELGGGTGGTTKHVIDYLTRKGVSFTYTFTDISGALVAAARKKFADRKNMEFAVIDIEKMPPQEHLRKYHVVLSTNCIHATKNLTKSTGNMRTMLRPDGFVSVVEFTRNMFWFDLVFGLLDGWWFFQDGRSHVLADQWFWDSSMRTAGFKHVTWTDGASEESRTLRIITAFAAEAENNMFKVRRVSRKRRSEVLIQTVKWKQAGNLELLADIYFPSFDKVTSTPRPVALMIHGGGHVMFTKKEVNPKQVKLLLDQGFLPVSIEYRFCPEINILEGPMTDACDALLWARHQLPHLKLNCPGLRVDGSKVAVVGWSTGGHLAMTTAFTSRQKGIQPPDAILAFYCPTDYESEWWTRPIYPIPGQQSPDTPYDLLEGVQDEPIASHYPKTNINYPGMLMSLEDPRWRFVLHMNWRAQHLPVLLNGLPSKRRLLTTGQSPDSFYRMPMPSKERIQAISPMSQIVKGNYRTPTYLIHGTADDLIPWEHSQRVVDGLRERGVESGIEVLDGVEHLFDTFSDKGWEEIQRAYRWLARQIHQ